jgi:hypothetical protein
MYALIHDPQMILQLLTAVTAIVAVIIGPLLTRRQIRSSEEIAHRQVIATVVSTNRQDWINKLRDSLADFLSKEMMARTYNRLHHADDESSNRIQEVLRLNFKVNLLINPKEPDHASLVESIDKLTNTIDGSGRPPNEIEEIDKHMKRLRDETVALSQVILKREWERVKSGE